MVATILGCSKNPVNAPVEVATKFPEPTWIADNNGKYQATMTAVVALPVALAAGSLENDKLAAFVNDECRGVGVMVKVNNQNLYFVLIRGLPEETSNITIRYYSSTTAYMYESKSAFAYLIDAVYGTAENSKILALTQLKK